MNRFIRTYLFPLLALLVFSSCSVNEKRTEPSESATKYASLLKIFQLDDEITLCQIADPWKEDQTLAQYLLVPKTLADFSPAQERVLAEKYGESIVIRTPLERMTLANACYGYLMWELGALGNVAVMCETEYVGFNEVKAEIEDGKITDCGSAMSPNIETILSKNSDAILITPFENSSAGNLATLPMPIVYSADYMETSPLGRAEWMKFYGALVNKDNEADSLFEKIVMKYNKSSNNSRNKQKTLLAELPYQSIWYVPGGQSTMSILYKDAGYQYLWNEDKHAGALPLSQEMVLAKAQDADIWIFKYYADHDYSLEEFLQQNPYFAQFMAARDGNVFACNTMCSDYYDITPFRPDILLDELKNLGGKYFRRLE